MQWGKAIAEGEYAEVFRGALWGKKVAIKRLKHREGSGIDEILRELRHEVSLMSGLRHPNVLTLIGSLEDSTQPSIVLEVMQGTLYELALAIYNDGGAAATAALLAALSDIVSGCAYLHGRSPSVLHRDLKPPNILYDDNRSCKLW